MVCIIMCVVVKLVINLVNPSQTMRLCDATIAICNESNTGGVTYVV